MDKTGSSLSLSHISINVICVPKRHPLASHFTNNQPVEIMTMMMLVVVAGALLFELGGIGFDDIHVGADM